MREIISHLLKLTDAKSGRSLVGFSEGVDVLVNDLNKTPPNVLRLVLSLIVLILKLLKHVDGLNGRLNQNSENSSRPPSSDSLYKKKPEAKVRKKTGGQKGHQGHRQPFLDPTEVVNHKPNQCVCGNTNFLEMTPFYTHQVIELPEIKMHVTHHILHRGNCPCCGKLNKAIIPNEHRTGYGPRLSALVSEMCGNQKDSRTIIQSFCSSVLNFPISLGAIQKIVDRASAAINPHYEAIAEVVRKAPVNNVDETSWCQNGALMWLWVLACPRAALFMLHSRRSGEAFKALIQDWTGILISDGYGVYRNWVGQR
ncbi:MAG: transposase, partial [Deltaproteobacteria bacterium]|nr:transposase [Deltaproteobacteria bacterium]